MPQAAAHRRDSRLLWEDARGAKAARVVMLASLNQVYRIDVRMVEVDGRWLAARLRVVS